MDWSFPRCSRRSPVFARDTVVTSHPLAAQLIYRLDNGAYCAASDHRKDGQAVGF